MTQATIENSSRPLHRPLFLVSLGFAFLMFGLPIYAKALGATALEIGGLYSVFMVSVLLLRPLIGWALDRFGRKRFLITGLAGYVLAMALFALASDLPGLYLARLVNGVASAITWITVTTITADLASAGERGRAMGAVNEMSSRGSLVGALLGYTFMTILSDQQGWQVSFWIYTVLAAAGVFLASRQVPESRPAQAASGVLPPRRPLERPFLWLMLIVFTTAITQEMITPMYMVYLQDHFTTDIGTLALAFFPAGILFSILPARLGSLSDRFGRAPFMALGLLSSGVMYLLIPNLHALALFVLLYSLSAVGWSMAVPAEAALVADLTGGEERGRAYGLYQLAGSLGATLGPLLGGWAYDAIGATIPFYMTGCVLLASSAWVVLTLKTKPASSSQKITLGG